MRPLFRLCVYAVILAGCLLLLINGVAARDREKTGGVGQPLSLNDALYDTNQTTPFPIRTPKEMEHLRTLGGHIARSGTNAGAAPCAQCHGLEGAGDTSGVFPRIAGLPVYYATKQLGDYAANARPNAVMTPIAQKLTPEEMEAVSVYYSDKAATILHYNAFEPEDILWGQEIATQGISDLGLAPCESCHQAQSARYPYSAPVLTGQYASYTALQLELWKRGVRDNDVGNVMSRIAQQLPEDGARAVAKYYEALAAGLSTQSIITQRGESTP